mmetsp:Transcript_5677/g.7607  ORF Transcript_5677/g.7607 Transcript_5677/m.7607 type:complete len:103 (-) Transcript_5677:144-452(-)
MVSDSVESLPVAQDPVTLSLHVTPPAKQVLLAGSDGVKDIASEDFGDDESAEVVTLGASGVRIAHVSRVSISYDVQKVDDMSAAVFLHKVKTLLDDPELLLL